MHDTVHRRSIRTPRQHARFQNSGLQDLYDGEKRADIGERKGIDEDDDIYAWMYSEEMADNIFMEAQSNAIIIRQNIQGEEALNETHAQVGREIRETIARLGGTMPEDLPTPRKSTKQLEEEERRHRTKGMDLFPPEEIERTEKPRKLPKRPPASDSE